MELFKIFLLEDVGNMLKYNNYANKLPNKDIL